MDGGHIAEKIRKVGLAMEAVEADDFLSHLRKRKARFTAMAKDAETKKDPVLELRVYTAEGKFLEMEGKALGAFRERVEHSGTVVMHFDKEDAGL
ncbi:MAG: hypothetical protein PHT99_02450 [Methanoregula sp.]|nr:hypothetical protein [Methanoregula sp.]